MLLTVKLASAPEPVTVEVANPDRVRYDLARPKYGWPKFEDAPFLSLTFLAYAALKRTGGYVGTWDDFSTSDCLDVEADDVDTDDDNENTLGKSTAATTSAY